MSANFKIFEEVVRARRTIKTFQPGPEISKDQLSALLDLAVLAPNHRLTEPWKFRVLLPSGIRKCIEFLRSESSPQEIQGLEKGFSQLAHVKALIVVTSEKTSDESLDWENYAATCTAVEHILLGAAALRIQSFWSTGRMFKLPLIHTYLEISSSERFVAAIYLGHGEVLLPSHRTPASQKTLWKE